MIDKTRGILLHHFKYSESSIIASFYTEKFGRQSYIINGVHSKKASAKAAIFQALFILDLEVYYKPGRDLNRLKNARIQTPYSTIPFDVRKSTVAIFLAEVLNKCLKEEEPNHDLFEFILHALLFFDLEEQGISNFHLWFLFKLTIYLGIFPNEQDAQISNYFDLKKACFVPFEPTHPHFMDKATTIIFSKFFNIGFSNMHDLKLNQKEKQTILQHIIEFYKIHFDSFGEIKSLAVLKEVFS